MTETNRYQFNHSTELPSVETFNHIKCLLISLGTPEEQVLKLPPGVISFIADHLGQINMLKDRIRDVQKELQESEFDVIRLRGQRNALRSALMKNKSQDPMLGYASDHMLEAITDVHHKRKKTTVN